MNSAKQSSIVSKCNKILDLLAESKAPLSLTQIVENSGIVKSSTHRVLGILLKEDLVGLDERNKTYHLGPKIMKWAMRAWHGNDILQASADELDELVELSGQNVGLVVPDEIGALYLRTVNSYQLRYVAKSGDHAPLHCTAVGKVLTAYRPTRERHRLFDEISLEKYTENTITDRKTFIREITQVAHQGWAQSDGEEFLQVCGIAAPIFDYQQANVGSICMWSLQHKADLTLLKKHLPALVVATRRVSQRLGYLSH